MTNINNIYDDVLLEHGYNPKNNTIIKKKNYTREAYNKLCGDNIILYINIQDNMVKNISFKGSGCVITTASTSIMTEVVKNKTTKEALQIFHIFLKKLSNKTKGNITIKELQPLVNAKLSPSRIKCATLGWFALQNALLAHIKKNTDSQT